MTRVGNSLGFWDMLLGKKPVRPAGPPPIGQRAGLQPIPRRRRNDTRHALPDPVVDPNGYLIELRKRMRKALSDYAAIEGRIGELYEYHVASMGDSTEGWLHLKGTDTEAKRLFSQRENSRQRAQTYAAAIRAELALDERGRA